MSFFFLLLLEESGGSASKKGATLKRGELVYELGVSISIPGRIGEFGEPIVSW